MKALSFVNGDSGDRPLDAYYIVSSTTTYQECTALVPIDLHVKVQTRRDGRQSNDLNSGASLGQSVLDYQRRLKGSDLAYPCSGGTCVPASIEVIHFNIPSIPIQWYVFKELQLVSSLSIRNELTLLVLVKETDEMTMLIELGHHKLVFQNDVIPTSGGYPVIDND